MKYGTSGFRDHHTKILSISEKIGISMALLSCYKKTSFGIMITASHNHFNDNGVKIMDSKGNMVTNDVEEFLENFINNDQDETPKIENDILHDSMRIIIGYDSRKSSPEICDKIIQGIRKTNTNFPIQNIEYVTTPQLHACFSSIGNIYISHLKSLSKRITFPCILDCANGIGSKVMKQINSRNIFLANTSWTDHEKLNTECSSDYVCTHEKLPTTPVFLKDLPYLRASLDGDADRIVFYFSEHKQLNILNGDYIAALIMTYLSKVVQETDELQISYVYTGYTNDACVEYVKSLKFPSKTQVTYFCTATGVKHLHNKACKYDIGVYFEQNGHGNVIFNKKPKHLEAISSFYHPNIGDGIMDFYGVLFILQELDLTAQQWFKLYFNNPSILTKHDVQDKELLKTTENELQLIKPEFLQNYIDKQCTENKCRAFVRPSGTENCVRLYVEGTDELMNKFAHNKISRFIQKYMNNLVFTINECDFSIRRVDDSDITNDYIKLLGQLTEINGLDKTRTFDFLRSLGKNHAVFVVEDYDMNKLVASGTILIEDKLIHDNGKVGHIEDIVVDKDYRGYGLGKKMIDYLSNYAKTEGCYKCILDCSDDNVQFYEKCGFARKGSFMATYFKL